MLSDDFKKSFGKLIILLKCQGSTEAKVRYSSTLLEVVESGLLGIGKSDQYKKEREDALVLFNIMSNVTRTTGRPEFVASTVNRLSNRIGMLLMPIIVVEQLALIDDSCFGITGTSEQSTTAKTTDGGYR